MVFSKSEIFQLTICVSWEIMWEGGGVCLWWVWSRLLVEIVEKSLHRQLQIHFFQQLPFLMSLSVPENYLYLDKIGRVSCILYSGLKQPVAAQTGLWRWSWRFLYRLTILLLWKLKIFVHLSFIGVVFSRTHFWRNRTLIWKQWIQHHCDCE